MHLIKRIIRRTKMRKTAVIVSVLILVSLFGVFALSGCTSSADLDERYTAYSEAVTAAKDTQNFYVKYSHSAEPNVTYKLNYSVDSDSKISAVFDKETSGTVSISHEYIYFGHALPDNVPAKDADASDYRTALFKGDEPPVFDVTAEEFLNLPEIFPYVPENFIVGLDLPKEKISPVSGVAFSVTEGVTETFSFTVTDPDSPYYKYCSDGNYIIVRAIQNRLNKISDADGSFSIVMDYAGPKIVMPTF